MMPVMVQCPVCEKLNQVDRRKMLKNMLEEIETGHWKRFRITCKGCTSILKLYSTFSFTIDKITIDKEGK